MRLKSSIDKIQRDSSSSRSSLTEMEGFRFVSFQEGDINEDYKYRGYIVERKYVDDKGL